MAFRNRFDYCYSSKEQYFLSCSTNLPTGLYTRLCHAFLVLVNHAGNKIDEVWQQISRRGVVRTGRNLQAARGGLIYFITQTDEIWPMGCLYGAEILKAVKIL